MATDTETVSTAAVKCGISPGPWKILTYDTGFNRGHQITSGDNILIGHIFKDQDVKFIVSCLDLVKYAREVCRAIDAGDQLDLSYARCKLGIALAHAEGL